MAQPLRRLISGPKARFVQDGVDLDLAYVTDRLIIMAFPAAGVATMWRNDRRVVRNFLDERHDDKWRVYNFCPRGENEYDDEEFYGRVSRYPFPDHHPPPLSMIPMVVADMTSWLAEDPENVVVIHCKAGKGRSGTLACCYLMSLPKLPSPPRDPRNLSQHKRAHRPSNNDADATVGRKSMAGDDPATLPAPVEAGATNMDRVANLSADSDGSAPRRPSFAMKARKSFSALRNVSGTRSRAASSSVALPQRSPSPPPPPAFRLDSFAASSADVTQSSVGGNSNIAPLDESLLATARGQDVQSLGDRLEAVFDFHASRRMKQPKRRSKDDELAKAQLDLRKASVASNHPLDPRFAASTPHLPRSRLLSGDQTSSRIVSPTQSLRTPRSAQRQAAGLPTRSMCNLDAMLSAPGDEAVASPLSPPTPQTPRTPRLSFALGVRPSRSALSPQNISPPFQRPIVKQRSSSFRSPAPPRLPGHLGLTPMGRSVDNLGMLHGLSMSTSGLDHQGSSNGSSRRWSRADDGRRSSRPSMQLNSQRLGSALDVGDGIDDGTEADDFSFSQDDLGLVSTIARKPSKPKQLGVSIPSQRRWVGYWARMLAKTDARATLDYTTPSKPARMIRIVRVSVLQETKTPAQIKDSKMSMAKKNAKTLAKMDSFAVSVGKYDDGFVERLEGWERGARRRARAYGVCNPSARAPVLTFSKRPENLHQAPSCVPGEDAWKARSRRPSSADWQKCADYNTAEAARKRLAQHDNEEGVGEWGVDVTSEAERTRHFNWPDGHVLDEDPKSKDFRFINWFTKLRERGRECLEPQELREAVGEVGGGGGEQQEKLGIWHHFEGGHGDKGKAVVATTANNVLLRGTSPPTPPPRKSFSDTLRRGFSRGNGGANVDDAAGEDVTEGGGILVSPDRELCIRVHLANKAFSILPDIAGAAGWAWFIPAFEDPLEKQNAGRGPRVGQRTVARFERDEIDFAKRITGLAALEVEWEWVDTGRDDGDDSDEEEESGGSSSRSRSYDDGMQAEEVESVSDDDGGDDDANRATSRGARQFRQAQKPFSGGGVVGSAYASTPREDSDGLTPSEPSLRTVSSRDAPTGGATGNVGGAVGPSSSSSPSSFATAAAAPTLGTMVFDSLALDGFAGHAGANNNNHGNRSHAAGGAELPQVKVTASTSSDDGRDFGRDF